MEEDPDAGIIQTLPLIINRNTLFARAQQFAAKVYGPVVAAGLSVWSGRDGNYWGHNAIIRTRAFAAHCGLPDLPGRPPLGGHVLSHDFVEAALMRRAGYTVYMLHDLPGSYEESPPSLIDVATRDRRWCQGNLQHGRIIGARGLKLATRQHFATGIMSYLASPFWLFQLIVGIALVLQTTYIRPEYFSREFTLFPQWPRFDPERALALFGITMAVLLAPKFFGLVLMLLNAEGRRRAGGAVRLVASTVIEILLSALMAPILMVIQSGSVFQILLGRDTGWEPQRRDDGSIPLRDIIRRHRWHTVLGLLAGVSAFMIATSLFLWMSPTIIGLILAIPLSWLSGRLGAGLALKRLGLLMIPEETRTPAVVAARQRAPRREPAARLRRRRWPARPLPGRPPAPEPRGDAAAGPGAPARRHRSGAGHRPGEDHGRGDDPRRRPLAEAEGAHGRPPRPRPHRPADPAEARRRGGGGGGITATPCELFTLRQDSVRNLRSHVRTHGDRPADRLRRSRFALRLGEPAIYVPSLMHLWRNLPVACLGRHRWRDLLIRGRAADEQVARMDLQSELGRLWGHARPRTFVSLARQSRRAAAGNPVPRRRRSLEQGSQDRRFAAIAKRSTDRRRAGTSRYADGYIVDDAERPAFWSRFTLGAPATDRSTLIRLTEVSAERVRSDPEDDLDGTAPGLLKASFDHREPFNSPDQLIPYLRRSAFYAQNNRRFLYEVQER